MFAYFLVMGQQTLHGAKEKLVAAPSTPDPQARFLSLPNTVPFARWATATELGSGLSMCHRCSHASNSLLSYVKETCVPTAQAIVRRELDFQVDLDTPKADQAKLDDVTA